MTSTVDNMDTVESIVDNIFSTNSKPLEITFEGLELEKEQDKENKRLRKEIEELRKQMTLQNAVTAAKDATTKLVETANIVQVKTFTVNILRKMDDKIRDRCPMLNRDTTQCKLPVTPYCNGICLKCFNKDARKEDRANLAVQTEMNSVREKQDESKRKAQDDLELAQDDYRKLKTARKLIKENTTIQRDLVKKRADQLAKGIESDDEEDEEFVVVDDADS